MGVIYFISNFIIIFTKKNNISYLKTNIEYLRGVGPTRAKLLNTELGIYTFFDLLNHFPFRYVDKTKVYNINQVSVNEQYIQLLGQLGPIKVQGFGRSKRMQSYLKDATGKVELIWFQGISFLQKTLVPGNTYLLYGKPSVFKGKLNFSHPQLTLATSAQLNKNSGFEPVYNSTEKLKFKNLDSKGLYQLVINLLINLNTNVLSENLPNYLLEQHQLMGRISAYQNIHQPKTTEAINSSRYRFKFEELFYLQLRLLLLKSGRKTAIKGFLFEKVGDYFNRFFNEVLPFNLTGAQKRVLKEIRRDTLSGKQMNRLLQGDVGSGKTIVAIMTMLMAIDNDFQACLMAPTEILAQQHFKGIQEDLMKVGLNVALLTGSVKGKARKQTLQYLKDGLVHVLVGTHALIEDPVVYKNLGLVVIDEQHRFGVAQRAKLWRKNTSPPHILVMTATPIPRTLALTVYGDLDVSVIDELPPGRKPVITSHRNDRKRLAVFGFIRSEIAKGRQVYIVYPLINESETLDLKDLMDGYESIKRAFPKNEISIVHGQMKPADKAFEMQRFVKHQTQIMVATTVIEVGVNVPNASIMIIENAERFGLSQLHQLRGRVGRGADQSYCILMTGHKISNDGLKRLKTMVETNDGFKIAEVDLEIRGPGNLEGTQQSGLPELKLVNLVQDARLLQKVRGVVVEILENDPQLEKPENYILKQFYELQKNKTKLSWSNIS